MIPAEQEVPNGWQKRKIKDVALVRSGSTPSRAQQERYFTGGVWPWVKTMDLNNGYISQTDEKITDLAIKETSCPILEEGTVLVAMYGGFNQIGRTGLLKIKASINQALSALIINRDYAEPEYVLHWLNANLDFWKQFAASSRKDPNITRTDVEAFPVFVPPLPEQRAIAAILSTWDEAITLTEALIEALQQRKQALMQLLYKENLSDGWQEYKLGDVTFESSTRLKDSDYNELPVYGVDNVIGLNATPRYMADNLERYKIVEHGMFAYNPMRLNIGSIGYSTPLHPTCLVSPDYVVFGCFDEHLLSDYLHHYTESQRWGDQTKNAGSGSVRFRIYYENLASFRIILPPLPEQRTIAELLNAEDDVLKLTGRLAEALREQKRALMQQLLTGAIRVQGFE